MVGVRFSSVSGFLCVSVRKDPYPERPRTLSLSIYIYMSDRQNAAPQRVVFGVSSRCFGARTL